MSLLLPFVLTFRLLASPSFERTQNNASRYVIQPISRTALSGLCYGHLSLLDCWLTRRIGMAADTLARLFWERVERSADRPAQQFKQGAGWKTITWREVGEIVREVALGLLALGRGKGDAVALLSGSRAEWVQADFAIFSAGCVTVPVYPTYPPELIAYIVNDSGARTIIVEDPAQLAKVLQAREKTPDLEHIIVISGYDAPQ